MVLVRGNTSGFVAFLFHFCTEVIPQASIEIPAQTVGEALAGMVAQHPDLRRHLYTDDGKLRAFVNVYVNDEDMRYRQKEATALKETDTISTVPSVAGGGGNS